MPADDGGTARAAGVAVRLRTLIGDRQLSPGERLGTERELAETLGIARTLLRQGLDLLQEAGRIRRVTGRTGGIYVADGKVDRELNTIQGVPAYLRRQGFTVTTRVLRAGLIAASAEEARALDVPGGSPLVDLHRLRLADGIPLSLETSRLPAGRFPGLLRQPLDVSLYQVLEREYGSAPARAEETVDIAAASPDEAAMLDIDSGASLLRVRRVAYDAGDTPIEFALDLFRGDRIRFRVGSVTGIKSTIDVRGTGSRRPR
jgi:GntR family transcriptional regulator